MCGILRYATSEEEKPGPIPIKAVRSLTCRGYDSIGARTWNKGTIDLQKCVGKVEVMAELRI